MGINYNRYKIHLTILFKSRHHKILILLPPWASSPISKVYIYIILYININKNRWGREGGKKDKLLLKIKKKMKSHFYKKMDFIK